MSILKNHTANSTASTTASATSVSSTEEFAKLLDDIGDISKRLRAADRQVKRLGYRLSDLEEDGCEARALKRAKTDLDSLDIARLKADTSKLEDDLNAAELDITKATETSIHAYKRRSAKLKNELEEVEAAVKDIDVAIAAFEVNDPAAKVFSIAKNDETNDEQRLSARMWALSMLPDYRAANCPPLKTPTGKEILFALPVPRPSGVKYIRMNVHTTNSEDLPDLVPGTMEKRNFVPLEDETGARAKALVVLVNSGKLW